MVIPYDVLIVVAVLGKSLPTCMLHIFLAEWVSFEIFAITLNIHEIKSSGPHPQH